MVPVHSYNNTSYMANFPYNITPKLPENQNTLMQNPLSIQSSLTMFNRLPIQDSQALKDAHFTNQSEKTEDTKLEGRFNR